MSLGASLGTSVHIRSPQLKVMQYSQAKAAVAAAAETITAHWESARVYEHVEEGKKITLCVRNATMLTKPHLTAVSAHTGAH